MLFPQLSEQASLGARKMKVEKRNYPQCLTDRADFPFELTGYELNWQGWGVKDQN